MTVANSRAKLAKARGQKKAAKRAASRAEAAPVRSGGYSFQSVGGKELNYVDTTNLLYPANDYVVSGETVNQVYLLNGIAAGTSASQRIGQIVRMKSIEMKFGCLGPQVAVASQIGGYATIRMAIVLYKQTNGAAPLRTDVWTQSTAGVACVNALRNMDKKTAFWVLWDSGAIPLGLRTNAPAGLMSPDPRGSRTGTLYKRINIPVKYQLPAADVGSVETNGLFLLVWSDSPAAAETLSPAMNFKCRVRYDDR